MLVHIYIYMYTSIRAYIQIHGEIMFEVFTVRQAWREEKKNTPSPFIVLSRTSPLYTS